MKKPVKKTFTVEVHWTQLKVKFVEVRARTSKEARKKALDCKLTGRYKGEPWSYRIGNLPHAKAIAVWNDKHEPVR